MKQTLGAFLVHSDHIYVETVTLILLEGTHIIVLLVSIAANALTLGPCNDVPCV